MTQGTAVFAVTTARGPRWDPRLGVRQQPLWDEHAGFADDLVRRGVIVLGGPVQDPDPTVVALIAVRADSEAHVHAEFAGDPWIQQGILVLKEVRGWSIWLGECPSPALHRAEP